ncbi:MULTISPECIES: ParA family protein [unclassified Rhodococcus (in: high G+C Gram-positive bacteria)]|uniref:ParA family protein n=1 Tax=unclassified Rhodococcus (in: high G+C Gram-positive bacteria) TaxID=192944 RepID=UPI00163ABAC5|nr:MULTISPECIES: ParA family protein [unclassified Rhodococcus (in: high G+C Gram-positive bacteria)]MBC2639080.1 ParA family protein [Rhodococcus sp. 3A]MBC2896178.1 ParA family protein [Rhodococcus sp. 4CII]
MTHVVATTNLKGGVGKTTTTAALGEMLSGEFGQRVMLIDLDPQTNLTMMMIGESRWGELDSQGRTLAALFEHAISAAGTVFEFDVSSIIQRSVSPLRKVRTVDLLPSSLKMIGLQERIAGAAFASGDSTDILLRALKPVIDQYDYVLIDCPPNLETITLNGLRCADAYIIPTIPDVMSTYGIGPVQERIAQFGERWGRPIVELGVVITKYRKASPVHRNTVDDLNRRKDITMVFPSLIPEANQIAAAAEYADFGTLRQKYGSDGQFTALRDLAQDFMATAKVRLGWA